VDPEQPRDATRRARPRARGGIARRLNEAVTSPWATPVTMILTVVGLLYLPPLGFEPGRREDMLLLIAIVTLLLVFLIEHNAERDVTALHVKLDEILSALREADSAKIGVEELATDELREIRDVERDRLSDKS
jgi:low affinity Fe/Cu permease